LTDFEALNEETKYKIGIYTKKWARQVLLKILIFCQWSIQKESQRVAIKVNGAVTGQIRDILVGLVQVSKVKDDAM